VLTFSTTFVEDISHSNKNSESYQISSMYMGLHVKYPLFLSDFNQT
jgi:hypothetical protein